MEVSGRAGVVSWVVTHHAFVPAFAVPYPVVLVRLAEQDDLLMYGNLAGLDAADLVTALPVRASFRDVDADLTLVDWGPG